MEGAEVNWWNRLQSLKQVAYTIRLPAVCQFLVYAVTLAAWPSIPGGACPEGIFKPAKDYYFTIIVAGYNVMDFVARCGLPWLQYFASSINSGRLAALACSRA